MFAELLRNCRERYGTSDANIKLAQWISENTTHSKRPFSYERYPFQEAIADDPHHNLAVEKCSQVGLTEIQIRKFLAILRRNSSLSGIFTLPNEKMFKRIYNARLKPILDQDAIFNPPMEIQPVRRMDLIQIYDSFGYITGCTEGDATSISADFIFHDELDLSPMNMIALFQSRLQDSDMKMTQAFSTPSFVDFGINSSYMRGDQREYMQKCSRCNHWQIPQFDLRFIHIPDFKIEVAKLTDITSQQIAELPLDEMYVKCERCQGRLDLNDAQNREWVATHPNRTMFRSYKVRPFSTARIPPGYVFQQLAQYQDQDYLRGFYNTVLGEPFTESSAQIQRAEIETAMASGTRGTPAVAKDVPVFLGLDFGNVCHLVLGRELPDSKFEFFHFEQIPILNLLERLSEIRQDYSIVQGCIDRMPFIPTANALRDSSAHVLMPVFYAGTAGIAPVLDEFQQVDFYRVNRTNCLDRVRTLIVQANAVISGYGGYKETVITHLRDMVRDEQPEKEPEWKKLNGNDHFFHAMGYCMLARRVCEHMYTRANSGMLMANALISSMPIPAVTGALTVNVKADRIGRLGVNA
jgi:hypothetical protein